MNTVGDPVSRALRDPITAAAILAGYVAFGAALAALGLDLPQWYLVLTTALALKVATGYRNCKVSYYECKARGVTRDRGVVDALVNGPVDLRALHPPLSVYLAAYAAVCWWYFGSVRGQSLGRVA